MNTCLNYRFLVPLDDKTKKYFKDNYKKDYQSSDGGPFCHIDEGITIRVEDLINLPEDLSYKSYKINDRFVNISDFICSFWDGDCEDEDFVSI